MMRFKRNRPAEQDGAPWELISYVIPTPTRYGSIPPHKKRPRHSGVGSF